MTTTISAQPQAVIKVFRLVVIISSIIMSKKEKKDKYLIMSMSKKDKKDKTLCGHQTSFS